MRESNEGALIVNCRHKEAHNHRHCQPKPLRVQQSLILWPRIRKLLPPD